MQRETHQRRILLVDDQPAVLRAVTFRLRLHGYTVLTASGVTEALALIANDIFHLAIVDVCLADQNFRTDLQGFVVIAQLPPDIPHIIYTAYENAPPAKLLEIGATAIVDKRTQDGAAALLAAVEQCFAKETAINLALQIEGEVDLAQVAAQIEPAPAGPPPAAEDIQTILQRFFVAAQRVELAPLLAPETAASQAQSGAVLLRAQEVRTGGRTAPVVVKLSHRAAIEEEARRYELIQPYVGGHRLARLEETAYSRQTGGLIYTLVGTPHWQALHTLAEILHLQDDTSTVVQMLRTFFHTTFAEIHHAAQSAQLSLGEHYTQALALTPEKLLAAVRDLHQPALHGPELDLADLFATNEPISPSRLRNPLHWVLADGAFRHDAARQRPVCLTHGDLHTRNILVDDEGQCWLVDFGRVTSASHALRDFAELETDIKFRVLPPLDWRAFYELESALLAPTVWQEPPPLLQTHYQLDHWRTLIATVRHLAVEQLGLSDDLHDYYTALFWHTLNVIRMRRMNRQAKRLALLSAALLAERLANWPGVGGSSSGATPPPVEPPVSSWWWPWRWLGGTSH